MNEVLDAGLPKQNKYLMIYSIQWYLANNCKHLLKSIDCLVKTNTKPAKQYQLFCFAVKVYKKHLKRFNNYIHGKKRNTTINQLKHSYTGCP